MNFMVISYTLLSVGQHRCLKCLSVPRPNLQKAESVNLSCAMCIQIRTSNLIPKGPRFQNGREGPSLFEKT